MEQEHWIESDNEIEMDVQTLVPPPLLCDSPQKSKEDQEMEAVVWWIVAFLSLFQTLHFIPERAMSWLFRFLCTLLKYCNRFTPRIAQIIKLLPSSPYMRDKYLSKGTIDILQHVVCRDCHSHYTYNQCIEKSGSQIKSKQCWNLSFSHYCSTRLLKEVVSSSGNLKLYPYKVYSHLSIITSLQKLLLRPGFVAMCESTRTIHEGCSHLTDIQNGMIWKQFLQYDGNDFLISPYCYAFMLNVDWFQPFENHNYSVGVIYLAVLNLPRNMRYKRENIILVGLIPGPTEPPLNINSYLAPLVSDLLLLWSGVSLRISDGDYQVVKAALLAVSCDLPAGRKVCGFLSHSANLGCSRCYSSFSCGFGKRNNYSNFDRSNWMSRSNDKHRADVQSLEHCKTKRERLDKELQLGCRYSELLKLPYFNPVRHLLIDPMHNLFLGTAKYVTQKIWIGTQLLQKQQLDTIHKRLQQVNVPMHIGRLPSRIDSGATFTAEQWMNWTIYFSIYCLHGLLSASEIECWRHFVLACKRLCKRSISNDDITVADGLLLQFGKRLKGLYGKHVITPNMHLQCHLSDCIQDYGPLHAFWLFSFERYNGILGNQPTNNRCIEMQLMNRFLKDNHHLELIHLAETMPLFDDFGPCVSQHAKSFHSTDTTSKDYDATDIDFLEPTKYTCKVLCTDEVEVLQKVYCSLYPQCESDIKEKKIKILTCVKVFSYVLMNGKKLSSARDTSGKVPYILARPMFPFGNTAEDVRPAYIQSFVQHTFLRSDGGSAESHLFAEVMWPQVHPQRHVIGKPVEVWCKDLYEPTCTNLFLPVQNVSSLVITAHDTVEYEDVLIVISIMNN